MIQELKKLIFEQCTFKSDEEETYHVWGMHMINGELLDVYIEIDHISEGHTTSPNSLYEEPEFIETNEEFIICELSILSATGEEIEINKEELENEINK